MAAVRAVPAVAKVVLLQQVPEVRAVVLEVAVLARAEVAAPAVAVLAAALVAEAAEAPVVAANNISQRAQEPRHR
jgi:hypothetical protein